MTSTPAVIASAKGAWQSIPRAGQWIASRSLAMTNESGNKVKVI